MGDRELVTVVDAGKRCQVGRIIVDAGGRRCGRAAGNCRFVGVQVLRNENLPLSLCGSIHAECDQHQQRIVLHAEEQVNNRQFLPS